MGGGGCQGRPGRRLGSRNSWKNKQKSVMKWVPVTASAGSDGNSNEPNSGFTTVEGFPGTNASREGRIRVAAKTPRKGPTPHVGRGHRCRTHRPSAARAWPWSLTGHRAILQGAFRTHVCGSPSLKQADNQTLISGPELFFGCWNQHHGEEMNYCLITWSARPPRPLGA